MLIFLLSSTLAGSLTLDVPPQTGFPVELLAEEILSRLPGISLYTDAAKREASTPGKTDYFLSLRRRCSQASADEPIMVDAVAGGLVGPGLRRRCLFMELYTITADGDKSVVLTQRILSHEGVDQLARYIAVLAEGTLRLHENRLSSLFEKIRSREIKIEADVKHKPAQRAPYFSAELSLVGSFLPKPSASIAALGIGVFVAVSPRLSAGITFEGSTLRQLLINPVKLSTRELDAALLMRIRFPELFGGGFGRLALALGPVLYAISASTGQDSNGDVTTLHAGLRGRTLVTFPVNREWSLLIQLGGDYLPGYPRHLWQGESIEDRGAWRLDSSIGVELNF